MRFRGRGVRYLSRTVDLSGKRFGKLTALENTGQRDAHYWVWRCRCDCGRELEVSSKRLNRGTVTHCGCGQQTKAALGPVPEDLTGKRYGKLTVLRLDKHRPSGRSSWLCQCDCGNQCVVTADSLHFNKRKSCGCLHRSGEPGEIEDLTGQVFGRLTALTPLGNGSWKCRCECGTEINVSQDSLLHGYFRSCGCVRQERQENLLETLTFVEHTCLEVLERRKSRSDNTSGFRGVSRGPDNKWLVTIGMQGKRYYVGLFLNFEDAVKARLRAEEVLHDHFVEAYQIWQSRAERDQAWAAKNPFYFTVEKNGHDFYIDTVFGSQTVSMI